MSCKTVMGAFAWRSSIVCKWWHLIDGWLGSFVDEWFKCTLCLGLLYEAYSPYPFYIFILYCAWKDTFVQLLWKWKSSPLWNALTFLPKGCSADLQKIKPQKLPFLIKNCLQPTIKKRSPPKIGIPFVENAFHKRTRPDQWCPIDRWDRVVLVGMV